MKVLVAEDDPTAQLLLERQLTAWGYEPVIVSDGRAAWNALTAAGGPRLALLDWLMPGIDGTEICRHIRERDDSESFHLIIITVRSDSADVTSGLIAGADDYICKPFHAHELRARLGVGERRLLGAKAVLL